MFKGPGSRNLIRRLSDGVPSASAAEARSAQRFGADSTYVAAVRVFVNAMPNSGSQQLRLRNHDENWLVSQWRWIVEHRKGGTDWAPIQRVLRACLDEVEVRLEQERVAGVLATPDAFAEADLRELSVQHQEDSASRVALHQRSAGAYRSVADFCNTQIEALRAKGRLARLMANRLTHGSAAR